MLSPGVWRHLLLGPRLRLVGGSLVLAVLAQSLLQKLPEARVCVEEGFPISFSVSSHDLNHEVQLLLATCNNALQFKVLLPQSVSLLLASLLLRLLPIAEVAHGLVALLLLLLILLGHPSLSVHPVSSQAALD